MVLIKKELFLKAILPILILLVLMAGTTIIYRIEQNQFHKGDAQFDLSYTYSVRNDGPTNLTSLTVRLALLKSWDNLQTVHNITSQTTPNDTTSDEYGNNFAWYTYDDFLVGQSVNFTIDAKLTVHMMDFTTKKFDTTSYDTNSEEYVLYTAYDDQTDPTDIRIQQVAQDFASKKGSYLDLAFEAYNFSSSYLDYKLLSSSRGASFALANGYGDCDEYMNLFIALSRANGIPAIGHTAWFADFETGAVLHDQGAVAHAYPMFMLPGKSMLPADPTRGKDALYDNWLKTDEKRITLTRGPNHPYRLLNYRWVPEEGFPDPTVSHVYEIKINQLDLEFFSTLRAIIFSSLIVIPILFVVYHGLVAKRDYRRQQEKLTKLLSPSLKTHGKQSLKKDQD